MKIYLLDVGDRKYGDCIVITKGTRSILIDGAHPSDTSLLLAQFKTIFGHDAPFNFNLLVVTHCHEDHIGCLPALVENSNVTFNDAFVADEGLGWGRTSGDAIDALPGAQQKIAFALQEEPIINGSDDEIRQMIEDAATLESKYKEMLATLQTRGTEVVRYAGTNLAQKISALKTKYTDFGLEVLGPTEEHLLLCAEAISGQSHDASDALLSDNIDDGDDVSTYRRALATLEASDDVSLLEDRPGVGAAKNNQSIVLKVSNAGKSALLAGDMQFAAAEISSLRDEMSSLRTKVADAGPYDFVKLSHHSSYNGFDLDVWNEWITPTDKYVFAHTGGRNDAGHPDTGVLQLLKQYRDDVDFARTDRNKMITVELVAGGVTMTVANGSKNNFRRNQASDLAVPVVGPNVVKNEEEPATSAGKNTPSQREDDGIIKMEAKVPPSATRVIFTVDFGDEKKNLI